MLCSSRYAIEEARINLDEEDQWGRLQRLSSDLRLFEPSDRQLPSGVSLPDKDAPILLAAIEAQADYLLTGDIRYFSPYFGRKIEGVVVALPSQYFKKRL